MYAFFFPAQWEIWTGAHKRGLKAQILRENRGEIDLANRAFSGWLARLFRAKPLGCLLSPHLGFPDLQKPPFKFRNLGTTPILKKMLSEWKRHSWSNSRNSGVFLEQLSEWHSWPNLCETPILRATLGAALGIGLDTKISAQILGAFFFQNWCGSCAADNVKTATLGCKFGQQLSHHVMPKVPSVSVAPPPPCRASRWKKTFFCANFGRWKTFKICWKVPVKYFKRPERG